MMHKGLLKRMGTACLHMALSASALSAAGASESYYRTRRGSYSAGRNQYIVDPNIKPISTTFFKHRNSAVGQTTVGSDSNFIKGQSIRELLIIDGSIKDKSLIFRQTQPGVDIVEIKEGTGLNALLETLSNYSQLDAVHIVSHANAGVLHIGGQSVNQKTFENNVAAFASINNAIKEGGDLMLYGCDLAKGREGENFLQIIRENTHVDIAASIDKTGNAGYGGNWELEIKKGDIEAKPLPESIAMNDFTGTLQLSGTKTFESWNGEYLADDPTKSWDGFSTYISTPGTYQEMLSGISTNDLYVSTYNADSKFFIRANPAGGSFGVTGLNIATPNRGGSPATQVSIFGYEQGNSTPVGTKNNVDVSNDTGTGIDLTTGISGSFANIVRLRIQHNNRDFMLASVTFVPVATVAPTVNTSPATNVSFSGATLNGNVASDGGASITERGFVYALTSDDVTPTVAEVNGTTVFKQTSIGTTGAFNGIVSGLSASSGYSYVAYAENSLGTNEGSVESFTTSAFTGFADQDFNDESGSSAPIDLDGIRYTGGSSTDIYVYIDNAINSTPNTDFTGKAIIIGNNSAEVQGYAEFFAIDNSSNFKISSFLIETYSESGGYTSGFTVLGYDNGVEKVNVNVDMNISDIYGSGANELRYTRNSSSTSGGSTSGLFSFTGSGWGNIDHVRIMVATTASIYYYVALDDIDFETAVTNSSPTASNIPSDISVTEDVASNVNLSGVTFADADGDALTVKLAASAGALAATSGGGVTIGGSGTARLTLTGTAANINTYLDTQSNIKYTGASNASGNNAATLTINANDGTVNPQLGIVNINITAVNDSPTVTGLPSDIAVTEDMVGNVDLSSATFADVDADDLTVALSVSAGFLSANSSGGVTISGSGTATLSLAGTAAHINTYLNTTSNIKYTSASNANGNNAATLTINVNDGTVNPQLGTVNIDITAVNDAPVASNVGFTGTLEVGGLLTGSYDYSDIESNTESGTTFKWYRYDASSGSTGKTQIGNASTYTLAVADEGKYISFEVTPNDGTDAGTPVESTRQGPVTDPASDINLKGNNVAIADGDATPSATDHTDFGSVAAASGTISRTFTIENIGSLDLTLVDDDGRGYVSVSGTNASDFTVTTQPDEVTGPAGSTTFVIEFDASSIGERNGTVNISSNDPDENPYTFAIKGTGSNTAPVISSSATASVNENTASVMTVTATDADSHALSFSISGGDDAARFSINASSGALSFKDAPDFENPEDDGTNNVYNVEVTVSDGNGGTDVQTFAVTIKDKNDNSPIFTSSNAVGVDENTTTVVTAAAADADAGSSIAYSITGGADQALFSINGSTGALVFKNAPDYEKPADADTDNGYSVQVTASDGTNTTVQTITVSVQDVNDNSPVFTSSNTAAVDENQTSVATVAATDADASAVLTFSITGGADQALFDIEASTGALAFDSAPDFENPADANADNEYVIQVRVSDGTNVVDKTMTVSINDLNDESPVFTSAATANINENTTDLLTVKATDADAGSSLSFSISGGADQALFSIDAGSGALVFEDAPDFENPADDNNDNEYVVQVTASDGTNSSNQTITVKVDDVNDESPVFTSDAAVNVDENATAILTVAATDADVGNTVAYSITGGADRALFGINSATGVLTFSSAPDYENPEDANKDNEYIVQVTASDGTNTTNQTVTVSVQNLNDNAPVINNATFALDENSPNGSAVGTNVATDADGDAITYGITAGNTGNSFAIDNSGTITVNDNTALDYETTQSFTLTINVTDGNFNDQATITVNLNDLSDNAPVITSIANVEVNEDNDYVYAITATDEDAGDELEFSASIMPAWLNLNDHGDGTATLSGIPTNDAVGNHEVTIEVVDKAGAIDVQGFTVTVNNVNDAPVVQAEIPDQKAFSEQAFQYIIPEVSFLDVDAGDDLTFMAELNSGSPLPAWLSFDSGTQTFSGTPATADIGSLTLIVTVSDKSSESVSDSFVLEVVASNHAPTDILLTNSEVEEHKPAGTLVGNFSTVDEDRDDVHAYVLVSGEGSEDNASFHIEGGKLLTSTHFDYEVQNSYSIRARATDNSGATVEKSYIIEVADIQDARAFIPNLFSPNDDGNNDTFRARSSEIKQISFRVFNHMGEMVFETSDVYKATTSGWDGRFKGKEQPSGTYVWQITGQFNDGTPISFGGKNTGNITLIR